MVDNQRLRRARLLRGWSQKEVAATIGTTPVNLSRWERGVTAPYAHFRQKLCDLFEMDMVALGLVEEEASISPAAPEATSSIIDPMLPPSGIQLFGRDALLEQLIAGLTVTGEASIALN